MTTAAASGLTSTASARTRRRLRSVDAWTWAWIALAVVTLAVVVGNDLGVFAPDTKPELYLNPDRMMRRALSSWQPDPQLGQTNYNTGILPVAALMTAVQVLGLPAWLMQRLLMVVLLMAGATGMGCLVTELTARRGAGPWLAGLVYAWHPWVVVGAATLPVRLPHALLPWLLVAAHRAATRGSWRDAAWAALAFAGMAGINGGVVNLMMLVPLFVLLGWMVATDQTPLRAAAAALVRISVLATGLSLYWLIPSLVSVGGGAGSVLAATEDPAAIGQLSPASEVVRGMGMWTSYIVIDGQVENPEQLALLTSGTVVAAGFLVLVVALVSLVGAPRRIQSLCAAMGGIGIGLMIGLNNSGGSTPLGRALAWGFQQVPALQAFRTTNKWGSLLVLTVALAVGTGLGTATWRQVTGIASRTAIVAMVALVVVAAGPLIPGQLHPLQIPIPKYWFDAAAATDTAPPQVAGGDAADADAPNADARRGGITNETGTGGDPFSHRLLFMPGNAQTRYLWGHRGVDDLDTALYDHRSVVWRSTIPQGSSPTTNMLTAFDLGLQQATLSPTGLTTHAGLLGVDQALVRTDTDWLRNFGRPTSQILNEVTDNPGIEVVTTFGPTATDRNVDPAVVAPDDNALTLVDLPPPTPAVQPLKAPLLVVGDAHAIDPMVRAGLSPATHPLLWVDDLSDAQLIEALEAGGRVVLTDTNQRRSWSISSLTDSHSPVLTATTPVAPSDQRSRTHTPDTQTVALPESITVTSSPEPYSVIRRRAAGHPGLAYDANTSTGWQFGTQTNAVGGWLQLTADQPGRVHDVQVVVGTQGKAITQVRIETDNRSVVVPVVDGSARAQISEVTATIRVTVTDTVGFTTAPATVLEVLVTGDGGVWHPLVPTLRLPPTVPDRADGSNAVRAALTAAPITVVLSRLAGNPDDPFDDEEARLRRTWQVPWGMTMAPEATHARVSFAADVAPGECHTIALLGDGDVLVAVKATAATTAPAGTTVDVKGCGEPVHLAAGTWTLAAADLVTVDHLSMGTAVAKGGASKPVQDVVRTTASATDVEVTWSTTEVPVVVSSGQAWHPGWQATAAGKDLGSPIVVDGWAAGWIVSGDIEQISIWFGPQRLTRVAQLLTLAVLAMTILVVVRRRRQ